jgi:hypothetical protein
MVPVGSVAPSIDAFRSGCPMNDPERPYVIISADCHAGADRPDYKPYLERRWHDEFDAWAAEYYDAWADLDADSEYKAGVSSFASPVNWDSDKRMEVLESEDARGVRAPLGRVARAQPVAQGLL